MTVNDRLPSPVLAWMWHGPLLGLLVPVLAAEFSSTVLTGGYEPFVTIWSITLGTDRYTPRAGLTIYDDSFRAKPGFNEVFGIHENGGSALDCAHDLHAEYLFVG